MDTSQSEPKKAEDFDILLIEHDPLAAKYLKTYLSAQNALFHFHQVRNGAEALDFLKHRDGFETAPKPKLVIVNVNVPEIDGYQVLGVMHELENLRNVPTIVIEKEGVHSVNAQEMTSTVDAVRNFLIQGLKGGIAHPPQPAPEAPLPENNPVEENPWHRPPSYNSFPLTPPAPPTRRGNVKTSFVKMEI